MPWYVFIHPIWQLIALYLGVKNLALSFNRAQTWTFSIRKHINQGSIFMILTVVGAIIGAQTSKTLSNHGNPISLSGHRFITFIIIAFLILLTISGLIRRKRWYRLRWLQFLHPWLGLLTVGLMLAQLFIALMKFMGW